MEVGGTSLFNEGKVFKNVLTTSRLSDSYSDAEHLLKSSLLSQSIP